MSNFNKQKPFTLIWRIDSKICFFENKIESSEFKTNIYCIERWNLAFEREETDIALFLNCRRFEVTTNQVIFHKFEIICPERDNIVSKEKRGLLREGEVGCYRMKLEDFKNKVLFQGRLATIQISMWGFNQMAEDGFDPTGIFLHSKYKIEKFSSMWNIRNFSFCVTDRNLITSPSFDQFVISMSISDDDEIKISIRQEGIIMSRTTLKGEIFLLDSKGYIRDGRADDHVFPFSNDPPFGDSWEFPSFLKKSNLIAQKSTFLVNDVLSLQCRFFCDGSEIANEIEYVCNDFLTPSAVKKCYDMASFFDDRNSNAHLNMLQKDLHLLYTSRKMTDVTFRIGDKTISAHKCVLAARSPVFSAMFEQEMSENKSGFVDIIDVNFNILDKMLMFMYCTKVQDLDHESARELMIAADKYQVIGLKEECSSFLKLCISDETVCQILSFSDMVQDKQLIESSIEYIKSNTKNIMQSEDWKQLVKTNSKLTTEVLTRLVLG